MQTHPFISLGVFILLQLGMLFFHVLGHISGHARSMINADQYRSMPDQIKELGHLLTRYDHPAANHLHLLPVDFE